MSVAVMAYVRNAFAKSWRMLFRLLFNRLIPFYSAEVTYARILTLYGSDIRNRVPFRQGQGRLLLLQVCHEDA